METRPQPSIWSLGARVQQRSATWARARLRFIPPRRDAVGDGGNDDIWDVWTSVGDCLNGGRAAIDNLVWIRAQGRMARLHS